MTKKVDTQYIKQRKYLGGFFMSGALMNKVWDLFGMDSAEPEEYDEENVYD